MIYIYIYIIFTYICNGRALLSSKYIYIYTYTYSYILYVDVYNFAGNLRLVKSGDLWYFTLVLAMAISYNWLFERDYIFHFLWGYLVLITGISGHNSDVFLEIG